MDGLGCADLLLLLVVEDSGQSLSECSPRGRRATEARVTAGRYFALSGSQRVWMEMCTADRGPGTGMWCLGGEVGVYTQGQRDDRDGPRRGQCAKPLDRKPNPCCQSPALRGAWACDMGVAEGRAASPR